VPTAAPATASVKTWAPMATMAAATAAASASAASATSSRSAPGARWYGGPASSTAQLAARAKLLVAWPLGKDWPRKAPTEGFRTYSVSTMAPGTAITARAAPDHRRVATPVRARTRVIRATGPSVPRSGSQLSSAGNRPRADWIRGSITASRPPGVARPARNAAHRAAPQTASSAIPAVRRGPGSSGRGPDARHTVPSRIRPWYAESEGDKAPGLAGHGVTVERPGPNRRAAWDGEPRGSPSQDEVNPGVHNVREG
jgi:hypothetical protein